MSEVALQTWSTDAASWPLSFSIVAVAASLSTLCAVASCERASESQCVCVRVSGWVGECVCVRGCERAGRHERCPPLSGERTIESE